MSLRRAVGRVAIGLVLALVVGEGAVRVLARVLRRDARLGDAGAVIYCIGDSFTYGQGVRAEEAWPQVLGGLLRRALGDAAPAIRSLAEPGRSSSVALADVASVLKRGDARLVLVMTGWNANDGDFAAYAATRRHPVPWATRLDLALQHSHLYRVAKQAVTYRRRTVVLDEVQLVPQTVAMSLYDFHTYQEIGRENLRRIARLCHAARVPCAFVTYPHQPLPPNPYTRTEYYHVVFGHTPLAESDYLFHDRRPDEIAIDAVIRHVGETEDIPVIDLQPAFDRAGRHDLFLADYHHPTAAGHALIAHAVFDAIARRP